MNKQVIVPDMINIIIMNDVIINRYKIMGVSMSPKTKTIGRDYWGYHLIIYLVRMLAGGNDKCYS